MIDSRRQSTFDRIVLVGFSGAGKSTVATILGESLGWKVIDLDKDLSESFGLSVPEIFSQHGEAAFRAAERRLLADSVQLRSVIIAAGGGAATQPDAWSRDLLAHPTTFTVTLDVKPETALLRLQEQQRLEGAAVKRPMLEGEEPLTRIDRLKAERQPTYDLSSVTLIVDQSSPAEIAAEIQELMAISNGTVQEISLITPSGNSQILIGAGLFEQTAELLAEHFPNVRSVWIISDANVGAHYSQPLLDQFERTKTSASALLVPPGEQSKSVKGLSLVYDSVLESGAERGDVIVALGGGVVGDLAGFAAATLLRGIGLVQIPTSLLAMVDSSVGGKTGINHATGKNLIGSFYQPPLVIVDPQMLRTLPPRELRQGWAEIIKHSVIQQSTPGGERGDLTAFLQRNSRALLALEEPVMTYLITRNIQLKAAVVEADEREEGMRAFLNFGHTLGHAIEAADYQLLHGEAIAIGIRAAMSIANQLKMVDDKQVQVVEALLSTYGLPDTVMVDIARVMTLMRNDKKRSGNRQRWILPEQSGGVTVRDDVEESVVSNAIAQIAVS